MRIALLIITDGRDDYLTACVNSLGHLGGPITERWMYDDTGDSAYRSHLATQHPDWRHFNAGPRQGCAGAFQHAWAHLNSNTQADYVFLIEQDFVFFKPIPLDDMAGLLTDRPHLAEVALRRQPWNEQEKAAGGIVEQHPDWYVDKADERGRHWLEHGAFFTTNPCLFRRSLLTIPWPPHQPGRYSEDTFHQALISDGTPEVPGREVRYAYWGSRDSGTWVEHIGQHRHTQGTGY